MPHYREEQPMRMLLGMILGAILTVGGAFLYDNWAPGPASTRAVEQRPMVNWDVVDENWRTVRQRARETWTKLSHKVTS
jgi:hypothetical protein